MELRRFPSDLAAILALTLLTLGVMFLPVFRDTPVRLIVGVPFVLFVPGYVLVSVLYPGYIDSDAGGTEDHSRNTGITSSERTALSFAFSMAIVSIVGLILNSTPFGLRLVPILVTLTVIIIIGIIVAERRRRALAPGNRFVVPWQTKLRSMWVEFLEPNSKLEAALNILLLISFFLAVTSIGYVSMIPTEGESFTGFYLLTEDEELDVEDYPTEFVVGESQSLVVGVENQEYRTMNYTVLVELHRVQVQGNSTQVVATERLQTFETRIEHNETWQRTHTVTLQMTGDRLRLTYMLYRGDPPASPTTENAYRNLQLWINVTSTN